MFFLAGDSVGSMLAWLVPTAVTVLIAICSAVFFAARWVGSVNTDRQDFREFMNELKADVKDILSRLPPSVVSRASPVTLTEYGERVAQCLRASEWASRAALELAGEVIDEAPYEVDERARQFVAEHLDEEMHQRVDECAYEFGVQQEDVLTVLRVVLRDELLRRTARPGPADPSLG